MNMIFKASTLFDAVSTETSIALAVGLAGVGVSYFLRKRNKEKEERKRKEEVQLAAEMTMKTQATIIEYLRANNQQLTTTNYQLKAALAQAKERTEEANNTAVPASRQPVEVSEAVPAEDTTLDPPSDVKETSPTAEKAVQVDSLVSEVVPAENTIFDPPSEVQETSPTAEKVVQVDSLVSEAVPASVSPTFLENEDDIYFKKKAWSFDIVYDMNHETCTAIEQHVAVAHQQNGRHCLIMPNSEQWSSLLEPCVTPAVSQSPFFIAIQEMKSQGYPVTTGWLMIPGNPFVILLDTSTARDEAFEFIRLALRNMEDAEDFKDESVFTDKYVFQYLVSFFFLVFKREKNRRETERVPIAMRQYIQRTL